MANLRDVMYLFEHRLIPMFFFRDKEKFCAMVHKDPAFLFRILEMVCEEEKFENPYSEEDIHAKIYVIDEKNRMLKIDFPKPETSPLCYAEYLFFDKDFDNFKLFTAEKSLFSDEEAMICGWTANGGHQNFGSCPLADDACTLRCIALYMQ